MKKYYITPTTKVRVVSSEQLLQTASIPVDGDKSSSTGESKPSFTIWEFMEEE